MNMAEMVPGMYKILDLNGDGVITKQDRYYSWKEGNPPLQFGLMIFMVRTTIRNFLYICL